MKQACDYLYDEDDLAYLDYKKNVVDKKKIDALTAILANRLATFKTKLNKEYDVYVSGGGILIDGLYASLQAKVPDSLRIVKDPVYSNATGLYKLGQMISNIGDHQVISHVQ